LCIDDCEKIAPDEKSGAKLAVMDGLDELPNLGCLRLGRSEMGSELVEEPSLSTRQGSPDPRLVLSHELSVFPVAPVFAGYMAGCRDQKGLRVGGRQLVQPGDAESDPRHGPREMDELKGLLPLGDRLGDDDPRGVVHEHARMRDPRCDDQLDIADAKLPGDAIEKQARRVSCPRTNAVARREAKLAEVGPQYFCLDARNRRSHLQKDVPARAREDMCDQARAIERAVLQLEARQSTKAEPVSLSALQVPGDCT
jgi:hypothetical protein